MKEYRKRTFLHPSKDFDSKFIPIKNQRRGDETLIFFFSSKVNCGLAYINYVAYSQENIA